MQAALTLPWPPSLNRVYRAASGRVLLSALSRRWQLQAANALPTGRVPPPMAGRLAVTIWLHPPARIACRRWDIANREKLICDLLTAQRVWLDDSQIDRLTLIRATPTPQGQAVIEITEKADDRS